MTGSGVTGPGAEQAALRYLDQAGQVHDDLRRILTQVSGFALMLMTSDRRRILPEASIRDAAAASAAAAEAVRALTVPAIAAHHHHHLQSACAALAQACVAATACIAPGAADRDRDALVEALKSTVGQLRILARLLPGFEPVDFSQACCAAHAPPAA